jgi:hypothetical protein
MDKKIHHVELIKGDDSYFYLSVDGQYYRIPWVDCSEKLAKAKPIEREYLKVSPSGYGLHWPLIDEDLAVTPLLKRATQIVVDEIAV